MKNLILITGLIILIFSAYTINAQSVTISVPVVQNGEMATDTLENGTVVTFGLSSDDAEQENDEMDTLHDDDLDAGWEGDPEDQNVLTTGLRFQGVQIPKGATIEAAHIQITSHEAKAVEDVANITIIGHKHPNSPTFTMDELITDRTSTIDSVIWTVSEEWGLWTNHQTVDISTIIQEIIDMPDWVNGNSLTIILKGKNQGTSDYENAREFESFENIADPEDGGDGQNHPERVPKLFITYSIESAVIEIPIIQNGEMATDTLENGTVVTFGLSSDDAEQENDEMDTLHDDDLDAGWEGDPEDQNVLVTGLRFQNVAIPANVQIDSAFLILCSHEAKNAEDIAEITIVAEATDDAQTFTMDQLITDRPQTANSLLWIVNEEWGLWTYHLTPDISGIIQEIIDRDGWQFGNALALLLKVKNQGTSDYENAREFESFENIADPEDGGDGQNHPERVPKLKVYFSPSQSINNYQVKKQLLEIYPNPAINGYVTIKLESNDAAFIRIYDHTGKTLLEHTSDNTQFVKLNIDHLPSGFYAISATQGENIYSQKLIIK